MKPETLNCPNCGAAISSDSPQCQYCESKLATIACASCFGMLFIGNKHCPHCGAAAITATPADLSILKCPRCAVDMNSVTIGHAPVRECQRCGGLWLDAHVFQLICADREHQSVILGEAFAHEQKPRAAPDTQIRYVPCPHCRQLMNRVNFAKCSDVIVDVCKGHGTWFDKDELRQIVEFIRGGGMERSRERLRHEIEFQQEKLHNEQLRGDAKNVSLRITSVTGYSSDNELLGDVSSAGGLLKFLLAAVRRDALHERLRIGRLQNLGLELLHPAVEAQHRRLADRNMEIACSLLDARREQFIDENRSHSSSLPVRFKSTNNTPNNRQMNPPIRAVQPRTTCWRVAPD